jgi:rhodanese-related sulfurtransferase
MSLLDYFRPIPTQSAGKIREFLSKDTPDNYNLVDVRQPIEYEEGHLAGAQLIPVGELPSRINELDPNKPTFTY